MSKKGKDGKDARYFALHHFMLKTDAWKALSAGARAVYVQLGLRYTGYNNGKIACSVRDAATECNLARNTASKAFRELIDLGFIEETRHGSLSRKTRLASEWRLTAFGCDLTGSLKSTLFLHRGALARERRLSQTRASAVANEGRECLKRLSPMAQTRASESSEWLKRGPVKPVFGGSPVANEGTHIDYHALSAAERRGAVEAPEALASPHPSKAKTDAQPKNGSRRTGGRVAKPIVVESEEK
jgi:hypothetical protein